MNHHCDNDVSRAIGCACQLLPAVQQIADKYKDFIGGLGDNVCESREPLLKKNPILVTRSDRYCPLKVSGRYKLEDSDDTDDENVSPREEEQINSQRTTAVTSTPNANDLRASSTTPLEMLRVPNESCPVHVKNTEPQSKLHHTIHVCRSRRQSQLNSSMPNHLTTNVFSSSGNQHTTRQTGGIRNQTNSTRKILTIATIIGFLLLGLVYKSI